MTPAPSIRRRLAARATLTLAVAMATLPISGAARASQVEDQISLPAGSQPEGIAVAPGGTFYTGSLATGTIYVGDVRTGAVDVLVAPESGRVAVGVEFDRGRLYVAGGPTGDAYVYDATTGATVAVYSFSPGGFVNDVVVTKQAAWFTDSFAPVLYRVPISPNGVPGPASEAEAVALTGDYSQGPGFNINGIDATPSGKWLVVVQSSTGKLFRVDPNSGETLEIDLAGETVIAGDGLLLHGRTLYVVQNELGLLTSIRLDPSLTSGVVVTRRPDDDFDVPTTVDRKGSRLYVINARFGTEPTPDTRYWVAVVHR